MGERCQEGGHKGGPGGGLAPLLICSNILDILPTIPWTEQIDM